jgi:hypothetical protein
MDPSLNLTNSADTLQIFWTRGPLGENSMWHLNFKLLQKGTYWTESLYQVITDFIPRTVFRSSNVMKTDILV